MPLLVTVKKPILLGYFQSQRVTMRLASIFNPLNVMSRSKKLLPVRAFSTPSANTEQNKKMRNSELAERTDEESNKLLLTKAEKVKQNVETASYGGVIIGGILVGGAMLYFVLKELFSGDSPNNIYSHAFKLCKIDPSVQDVLGSPIKCYGEETRRGWRRHVAHNEFTTENGQVLRMKFYIEGSFRKGTVHLEKTKEQGGKYQYKYLIVDVEGYPSKRINVNF